MKNYLTKLFLITLSLSYFTVYTQDTTLLKRNAIGVGIGTTYYQIQLQDYTLTTYTLEYQRELHKSFQYSVSVNYAFQREDDIDPSIAFGTAIDVDVIKIDQILYYTPISQKQFSPKVGVGFSFLDSKETAKYVLGSKLDPIISNKDYKNGNLGYINFHPGLDLNLSKDLRVSLLLNYQIYSDIDFATAGIRLQVSKRF